MLEIMSLFDKGQQRGSVWLLGSREFNSFDRLVLFVKRVLKSVVDEYRLKLVTFNFIMNELKGRGVWEDEFDACMPAKLEYEEMGLSAGEFERLKRSISTEGQGGNVVTSSLNPSNLSSSNLSSNKFVNSSSPPPFSLHAPVESPIFLSHSRGKGEEIGVRKEGVVVGDFEGALTSNGFLKIQERGGVDLPKMPSVLPVSVGDWLEYEAAVLTKLELGERVGEEAVVELCRSLELSWVERLCCNQGVRSKDVGNCLSLLRSWVVGLDWEEKLLDYWRSLTRPETIFKFQCEIGRVVDAFRWSKEFVEGDFNSLRVRDKVDGLLTERERRFLKNENIDVEKCKWDDFWVALEKIHNDDTYKESVYVGEMLLKEGEEGELL